MKSIALIGFATAGKTTVGKILASRLGCSFVDCDQLLEETHGKSISQLFNDGEQQFRALENQLLATLPTTNTVIACGGGAVENTNFNLLAHNTTVVWLNVDLDTCLLRLGTTARPLHDNKDETQLAQFMARRNNLYASYANVVVDANGNAESVVQQICDKLN